MLVSLEGIDLSGKSTQTTLLTLDFPFRAVKFPRQENRIIQDYLKGKESFSREASFFVFLSDIIDGIKKLEEKEKNIICDRYVYSTIAYAQKISFENAKKIITLSPIKKADIVFYIDIDLDEYKNRINRELDKYEKKEEIQRTARERYLKMAEENFFAGEWVTIDGKKSVEEIYNVIKDKIMEKIKTE